MTDLMARHHQLRPLMFSIAYRMLGSVSEAEDVVQDAFLRMHQDPAAPANVEAYAATVTTRLAIDCLRSARKRRETYPGTWLPEPLLSTQSGPAERAEQADTLSLAFLVLLERLSPIERAVFLLREVFEYDYDHIADVVGKSAVNCRQILARARERIRDDRARFQPTPQRRHELAERFLTACETGDLAGLEAVLAEDVAFCGDGGGKVPALATPATGRTRVARFILGLLRHAASQRLRIEPALVNGQPGAKAIGPDGRLAAVLALHMVDDRIAAVYNVVNPDKLGHLPAS